ncbi:hypothetical protein PHYBLDRAFT_80060 [Phycomyces blakesleeanus NRRL 1555(-)]|uniref:RING-type domain-containing protein n=1 Tax=Phycomyces blakesleeanus (strain ATCC 8743b / DSM 1359 / FGSC 10004 / NBRC 33097 / NRRL 1555) TaxID=763407 RepID=A0A167RDE1_PHYB8|nr:hypothetical protein PHYBLDRAFT_80060 [Phycomyces blakesleeanus NRRL 1555(-)]OAD81399.1 hypothetical protein PHYBLDRAFT_80060 [Phycomyces blakesleeanus NRRL 1555(-)]|eukprot:XP_018299439.1 hypothetical protein PHYBLDRAFT_80060 [Phycomyces blakesleeanus NRRL 1555(-)]
MLYTNENDYYIGASGSCFQFFLPPFFHFLISKLDRRSRDSHGPGGVFVIPRLDPIPELKQCVECGVQFSLFRKKYFCRNCGNVVCSNCSDQRRPLPKFGYEQPVRCCDTCDTLIQMQQMNSSALSSMPLKQLKYYIDAYNLFAKTAIEKGDLVLIILNTRPISNDHEVYYRSRRIITIKDTTNSTTQNNSNNRTSQEFSFNVMFNDLFGNSQRQHPQRQNSPQPTQPQSQPPPPQPQPQSQNNHFYQSRTPQPTPPPHQPQYSWEYSARAPQSHPPAQPTQSTQPSRPAQSTRPTSTAQPTQNQSGTNNSRQQQQQQQQHQQQAAGKTEMSLDDMLKGNINPANLSVRTLKATLRTHYVEQSHLIEKSEFVSCVQRLLDERKAELKTKQNDTAQSDDTLCRICCDAQQNCVYLNCGHMMTCMDCGKKLVERNNQCPICREPILKLVHVFRT